MDEKYTQFSIPYDKPHLSISRDTLARWVKEVMACAYIDVTKLKSHNTRGVSTSSPADNYLFEVNNKNTRKYYTCSKLTIKTLKG